jgi:serine/threonine-protein kinase SRPK3
MRDDGFTSFPIEQCIRLYGMYEEDIPEAAAFIRRCLTIDPRIRPSALDLLDDDWLKGVKA